MRKVYMKVQQESENTESQCRCKNSCKPTKPELNKNSLLNTFTDKYTQITCEGNSLSLLSYVDVCTIDMVSINMFLFLKD